MTIKELRELLAKATPETIFRIERGEVTADIRGMTVEWADVIDEAVDVLPALLDIAEKVAAMRDPANTDGDCMGCGKDMEEFIEPHAPDCAWLAAKALVGGK